MNRQAQDRRSLKIRQQGLPSVQIFSRTVVFPADALDIVRIREYDIGAIHFHENIQITTAANQKRWLRLAGRRGLLHKMEDTMEYMSILEAAAIWNVSKRRIQVLCSQNRISGACKIGNMWAIPKTAEKPPDARVRSGKYRNARSRNDMEISR
ncbi:MAG: helix-turn-helix domain-containing protein [Aristaeellaceae bacterium]